MRYGFIIPVSVLLCATAVAAQPSADEQAKQEKKICRSDKMTGSLTRVRRICMTEAEWRESRARTKKGVDELQSSASGSQCVSADPLQGGRC